MVKAIGSDSAEDLSQLSDEELMSRYREEGKATVFSELVHRYERELYRYLARYLGDPTSAEDVFQNTFLQVHLKRGLFENGRPFRPWLYAIATHQAVDALRKSGRHPTVSLDQRINSAKSESDAGNLIDLLVNDDSGPLAELQEAERQQWVRESIARLPDALRQTLILAYHQDLKYREIAEILKIPVGTVKSRLHAALEKLQQMARAASVTEMNDAMNAEKMIENVLCGAGAKRERARASGFALDPDQIGSARIVSGGPFIGFWTMDPNSSIRRIWRRRTLAFVAANRRRPMSLARASADPPAVSLGRLRRRRQHLHRGHADASARDPSLA